MPTSALSSLMDAPLSAVRGALDTVRYAQRFVVHTSRQDVLRNDDDERDLILEEELGDDATTQCAAHAVEPPAA